MARTRRSKPKAQHGRSDSGGDNSPTTGLTWLTGIVGNTGSWANTEKAAANNHHKLLRIKSVLHDTKTARIILADGYTPSKTVFTGDKETIAIVKAKFGQNVEVTRDFVLGADQHIPW